MNTATMKRKRSAATEIFVQGVVDHVDSISGGSLMSAAIRTFDFSDADDNEDQRCCNHHLLHPSTSTTKEEQCNHRRHHNHHPPRRHHNRKKAYFNMNLFVTAILTLTTMVTIFPLSSHSLSDAYQPSSSVTPPSRLKAVMKKPDVPDHFHLVKQQRRNLQVDASTTTIKETKKTATATTESTTKNGILVLQDPESNTEEVCEPIEGTCQQCTFSEQKSYEACVSTGRWMKYECTATTSSASSSGGGGSGDDNNDKDPPKARIYMRSCQYTKSDEEFAMVRLQVISVLLGVLAIMSVKRNKRVSASLFDQRKLGLQPGNNNNNQSTMGNNSGSRSDSKLRSSSYVSENDEEIEFTPMTNQQQQQRQQQIEMAPLVGSSNRGLTLTNSGSSHGLMSVGSYDELEVI